MLCISVQVCEEAKYGGLVSAHACYASKSINGREMDSNNRKQFTRYVLKIGLLLISVQKSFQ